MSSSLINESRPANLSVRFSLSSRSMSVATEVACAALRPNESVSLVIKLSHYLYELLEGNRIASALCINRITLRESFLLSLQSTLFHAPFVVNNSLLNGAPLKEHKCGRMQGSVIP